MYKKIVIGIDQSYTRAGISIAADNKLLKVSSVSFRGCKSKSDKRKLIRNMIRLIIEKNQHKAIELVILCERIRTFSKGQDNKQFLSTGYIKATGALIATIVDVAHDYNVSVYSVDTRSWKSKIVGTSKKQKGDAKANTIRFIESLGFDVSSINKKGNIEYNDDAADSGCIALYGFLNPKKQNLLKEE